MKLTSNKLTNKSKSWTYISLLNISKLTVIVIFIMYELFNQQQVLSKSRGLIYNKDGKFIFRPAKSNQGHIIVIDDRHRESSNSNYQRDDLIPSSAAYPPYPLINQRLYRPDAVGLGGLAMQAGTRAFHNQAEQIQMISLNDLQNFAQGLGLARVQYNPSMMGLAARASLSLQNPSLAQTALSPAMPMFQLIQPTRKLSDLQGYNYVDPMRVRAVQDYEMQLDQQQNAAALADGQFGQRFSINRLSGSSKQFEPESALSSMDILPMGLSDSNAALLDNPPSSQHYQRLPTSMKKHHSDAYAPGPGEFDSQLMVAGSMQNDDTNKFEIYDEQFLSHKHAIPQLAQPLTSSPIPSKSAGLHLEASSKVMDNYNRLSEMKEKPSSIPIYPHEKSAKFSKRIPNSKLKNGSMDMMRTPSASELDPVEVLNIKEQKDGRYWKQFRDQFEIVEA